MALTTARWAPAMWKIITPLSCKRSGCTANRWKDASRGESWWTEASDRWNVDGHGRLQPTLCSFNPIKPWFSGICQEETDRILLILVISMWDISYQIWHSENLRGSIRWQLKQRSLRTKWGCFCWRKNWGTSLSRGFKVNYQGTAFYFAAVKCALESTFWGGEPRILRRSTLTPCIRIDGAYRSLSDLHAFIYVYARRSEENCMNIPLRPTC